MRKYLKTNKTFENKSKYELQSSLYISNIQNIKSKKHHLTTQQLNYDKQTQKQAIEMDPTESSLMFLSYLQFNQTNMYISLSQCHWNDQLFANYLNSPNRPQLIFVVSMEEEVEYEYSSQCENYSDYCQGGYHPVYLGEKINSKYNIIQKLGWGHFSTVWLAETESPKEQYAVKIQRSKESHAETALDEIELLKKLRQHEEDKGWVSLVDDGFHVERLKSLYNNADLHNIFRPLLLYDSFPIYGIHGKHYCSVFEVMGPNLLEVIQHFEYKNIIMPINIVKKITRDVLIQLIYLHDFVHMIHTDLKPENVLLKLNSEDQAKFVESLRNYKVKPISMKFLYKTQTKNPAKNKHKYDKKKQKKKAAKEAQKNVEGKEEMEVEEEEKNEQSASQSASQQTQGKQKPSEKTEETKPTEPNQTQSKPVEQKPVESKPQQTKPIETKPESTKQAEKKPSKKKSQRIDVVNDDGNSADSEPDEQSVKAEIPVEAPKKKKKKGKKKKKAAKVPVKKNSGSSQGSDQSSYSDRSDRRRNNDSDFSSDYSSEQEQKHYTKDEINTLKWKNIAIDLRKELHFKICDYGNATMQDKHFTENIQTRQYRSPEVIIGHPYLPNTDIWSLACMVYEMLTNTFLFKPKSRKSISKDEDHLYLMMELLGAFPKQFLQAGENTRDFFTKKGDLVNGNPHVGMTIGRMLEQDHDYTLEQAKQIEEFLLPMLQYDPAKRISAAECIKNKWLWS